MAERLWLSSIDPSSNKAPSSQYIFHGIGFVLTLCINFSFFNNDINMLCIHALGNPGIVWYIFGERASTFSSLSVMPKNVRCIRLRLLLIFKGLHNNFCIEFQSCIDYFKLYSRMPKVTKNYQPIFLLNNTLFSSRA